MSETPPEGPVPGAPAADGPGSAGPGSAGTGSAGPVAPVPTQVCPHCSNVVPVGLFCGACGAHLAHPGEKLARQRRHAYAAFPDEPVLHLSLVSSLFPHLAHRSAAAFRAGAAFLVGLLLLFSATDLEAPVIAVAALGLPLLFQLYVYEVDVYEKDRFAFSAVTLLAGAALGVGWALVGGPVVASALQPSLFHPLTGGKAVAAAVAVPAVGEVLMCAPMIALLAWRPALRRSEPLDGFTLGAAGALGFTFAAIITNLASSLSGGVFPGRSFVNLASEALVRGLAQPVTAAAGTGLIGVALWRHGLSFGRSVRTPADRLVTPLPAVLVAVGVQVGEGFAGQARLADVPLLLVQLAGAAVLLVALRVAVHQVLLVEQSEVRVGPPRACPHCHHLVPAMPFCPACGVAEGATPKRQPRSLALLAQAGAAAAGPSQAGGPGAWPLASAALAESWSGYPLVPASLTPAEQRSRHVVVLSSLAGGVAALALALSLTAILEAPSTKPSFHCRLFCFGSGTLATGTLATGSLATGSLATGPLRPGALDPGRLTSAPRADPPSVPVYAVPGGGISVTLWVASPLVDQGIFSWSASTSQDLLTVKLGGASGMLNGKKVSFGGGVVQFVGGRAGGASAQAIVGSLVSKNVPSAQLAYSVDDAMVGYQPGYAAVYNVFPVSSSGQPPTDRLFVAAAVRGGHAAVVWAYGPYDPGLPGKGVLAHPSFIDLDIALVLDPMLNSVTWTSPHLGL